MPHRLLARRLSALRPPRRDEREWRARVEAAREALAESGLPAEVGQRLDDALVGCEARGEITSELAVAVEEVAGLVGAELPRLRPANLRRSLVHVGVGCALVAFIRLADERTALWTATCVLASVWAMELARRTGGGLGRRIDRALMPTAHPFERRAITSGTWYATSFALLAWTLPPALVAASIAVLALGDPAASVVGRRWGRVRLGGRRTLEGSLALVLVGGGAAYAALALFGTDGLPLAAAAAAAGALAEHLSRGRLDDNLTIPLVAGLAMHLVQLSAS